MDEGKLSKEEFIKLSMSYATKRMARKYAEETKKETYTDNDLMEIHRRYMADREKEFRPKGEDIELVSGGYARRYKSDEDEDKW